MGRTTSKTKSIVELIRPYQEIIDKAQFEINTIIAKEIKTKNTTIQELINTNISEVKGFLGYKNNQKI